VLARYDGRPYLRGDCQYYYYTAVSLWVDRDLDLANQLPPPLARHSSDVALDSEGRLVPKHPIVLSLTALPMIAVFGPPGALSFNLVQLALLLFLTCGYARRLASPAAASIAVIASGLATFLPHYVWNFSPDIFATVLLVAALTALPADWSPDRARHLAAGVLLGFAVVSKFPLVLAIPGIPLVCGRPLRRTLPCLAVGLAVPLALWAALNTHLFGSPLVTSYDRMAVIEHGSITLHSQRSDFDLPLWAGVRGQLADRNHGLFFTSPVTLLSVLGIGLLARRDRKTTLYLTSGGVALFLLFSKYRPWDTSHYGNRFLMPLIVLAAVPLAALIDGILVNLKSRRSAFSRPTTSSRTEP
jgi:hypothetical protein